MVYLHFSRPHRFCLRDMVFSIFTVIVGPAVNRWNFSRPVAVSRENGCCPLNSIGFPRIQFGLFSSFKNAVPEIENEKQLCRKNQDSGDRDKLIQFSELVERFEGPIGVISS